MYERAVHFWLRISTWDIISARSLFELDVPTIASDFFISGSSIDGYRIIYILYVYVERISKIFTVQINLTINVYKIIESIRGARFRVCRGDTCNGYRIVERVELMRVAKVVYANSDPTAR